MDPTTYNVRVVATEGGALTKAIATSILDVCRDDLDETLPELDTRQIILGNDHDVTFVPGTSLDVGVYQIPMGRIDTVLRDVQAVVKDLPLDVEIIEYSPETDENPTVMSTIVGGSTHHDLTCFIDGAPALSLTALKAHLKAGDLEEYVRGECAKLVAPSPVILP